MGHLLSKEPHSGSDAQTICTNEQLKDDNLLSNTDWIKHANDLSLHGKPVQVPRMAEVKWKNGQTFTEKDDPDRMTWECNVPKFVTDKNPLEQKKRIFVEDIDLQSIGVDPNPNHKWPYHSFAKVIHNILTPAECEELLNCVNEKGNYW